MFATIPFGHKCQAIEEIVMLCRKCEYDCAESRYQTASFLKTKLCTECRENPESEDDREARSWRDHDFEIEQQYYGA